MTKPGTWQAGQSGNPKGRPPKNRALTEILARAGAQTVVDHDGKKRSGRRVLARMLWELAATGRAMLPDGRTLALSPTDWVGVVRFLYGHIDGPPKAEVDVTSGGEPLVVQYVNDWRGTSNDAEVDPASISAPGTEDGAAAGEAVQLAVGGPALAQDNAHDVTRG